MIRTRVLVVGIGDPGPYLALLERWNGPLELVPGRELRGVDLVLALPGGNGEAEAKRARQAGVRVAEVADAGPHQRDGRKPPAGRPAMG